MNDPNMVSTRKARQHGTSSFAQYKRNSKSCQPTLSCPTNSIQSLAAAQSCPTRQAWPGQYQIRQQRAGPNQAGAKPIGTTAMGPSQATRGQARRNQARRGQARRAKPGQGEATRGQAGQGQARRGQSRWGQTGNDPPTWPLHAGLVRVTLHELPY